MCHQIELPGSCKKDGNNARKLSMVIGSPKSDLCIRFPTVNVDCQSLTSKYACLDVNSGASLPVDSTSMAATCPNDKASCQQKPKCYKQPSCISLKDLQPPLSFPTRTGPTSHNSDQRTMPCLLRGRGYIWPKGNLQSFTGHIQIEV